MAETKIEWADYTFNPWLGCVKVSPACDNCYAEAWAKRSGLVKWGKGETRRVTSDSYWKQLRKWNESAKAAGQRKRVFCGSLCDVMEDGSMQDVREGRLYPEIEVCDWLDFLMLTKRPQNFRRFLPNSWLANPRPNVWLMTTVEHPDYMWRVDALRDTPAVVRGLSIEPLLGSLNFRDFRTLRINWVIVGGESGSHARPMHPDWVRQIRNQCIASHTAFLFKQWGEWLPTYPTDRKPAVKRCHEWNGGVCAWKVGKHAAGRLLDGREWNEFPC